MLNVNGSGFVLLDIYLSYIFFLNISADLMVIVIEKLFYCICITISTLWLKYLYEIFGPKEISPIFQSQQSMNDYDMVR